MAAGKQSAVKRQTVTTVTAIPVCKAGKWVDANGKKVGFELEDLDAIVQNTNALIRSHIHEPPGKLGHSEGQEVAKLAGMPSLGYVSNLYRVGDQVFADMTAVPEDLVDLMAERRYDKVSPEIYQKFIHPNTGEDVGPVMRAVAFLGADVPAQKGMGSILFHSDRAGEFAVLTFSEGDMTEVNAMKQTWTREDVVKGWPAYEPQIKKIMLDRKIESIELSELPDLVTAARTLKMSDDGIATAAGVTPPGSPDSTAGASPTGTPAAASTPPAAAEKPVDTAVKQDPAPAAAPAVDTAAAATPPAPPAAKLSDGPEAVQPAKPKTLVERLSQMVLQSFGYQLDSAKPVEDQIKDAEKVVAMCGDMLKNYAALSEAAKAAEAAKPSAETLKLQERIDQMTAEKVKARVDAIKVAHRGILQPRLDPYIDALSDPRSVGVVKLGEQEFTREEAFVKMLQELVKSTPVALSEIAPSAGGIAQGGEPMPEMKVEQQDVDAVVNKLSEYDPSYTKDKIQRADLAALATKIKAERNCDIVTALSEAEQILKKEGK